MTNPYATAARLAKAEKLATAAEIHGVETLSAAPDAAWRILAELAECKPPSNETKAETLRIMRDREAARLRIAAAIDAVLEEFASQHAVIAAAAAGKE